MTGLVWKDILVMRKTLKYYLLIMVIYAVLACLDILQFSFIITFIQVLIAVVPFSAFAYDEQTKWDRYARTLPIGPRAMVGARYLFVLILFLAAFARKYPMLTAERTTLEDIMLFVGKGEIL